MNLENFAIAMPWHEPRPISTLPEHDLPEGMRGSDSILVFNPCDGWHLLWLVSWNVEYIRAQKMFTHWMPGPPSPDVGE